MITPTNRSFKANTAVCRDSQRVGHTFFNTFFLIFDAVLSPNAKDAHQEPLELKKLNTFCTFSKNLDILGEILDASDITKFKL